MIRTRMGTPTWAFVLLLLLGFALVQQAAAAPPPPPRFLNFTITNTLNQPVTGLNLKLYPTKAPKHDALDAPILMTMSAVPPGTEMVIRLQQTFGIARIEAFARCPGSAQSTPVTIQGLKANHDNSADGSMEYACFTSKAPAGKTDYVPRLEFTDVNGVNTVRLHGKYRWDDVWPPNPVEDSQSCR